MEDTHRTASEEQQDNSSNLTTAESQTAEAQPEEKAPAEVPQEAAHEQPKTEQDADSKTEQTKEVMRAAIYSRYSGSAAGLEFTTQHPKPHVTKKNDVLIRVHATSINPIDWKMMSGSLKLIQFGKIFPFVPCFDVSGVVVDVGANCKRIKKGDEVWAMTSISCGSAADYVVVPEKLVALKPSTLSHTEAASIPLAGQTVYQCLVETAKIKEGQKVFILGGSGGCGSLALQLAKHYKCDVTTTCSERNTEFVRGLGADRTVDYNKENWWEVLKGENYDIVFDTVGGPGVWDHSQKVLKKDGIFVTIASEGEEHVTVGRILSTGAAIVNRKFWSVFGFPKYHFLTTTPNWTDLFDLRKLIDEARAIRPVVERVYPLEETAAAFEEHMKRKTRGKIVIQVVPDDQVQVPSSCLSGLPAPASSSSSSSSSSSAPSDAVQAEEDHSAKGKEIAEQEHKAVEDDIKPVEEEHKAVEEDIKPVEEEHKVVDELKLAEEQHEDVEGEDNAVEEDTKPAEEEHQEAQEGDDSEHKEEPAAEAQEEEEEEEIPL